MKKEININLKHFELLVVLIQDTRECQSCCFSYAGICIDKNNELPCKSMHTWKVVKIKDFRQATEEDLKQNPKNKRTYIRKFKRSQLTED